MQWPCQLLCPGVREQGACWVPGWGSEGDKEQVGIQGLPGSILPHAHLVPIPCDPVQANHLLSDPRRNSSPGLRLSAPGAPQMLSGIL